MASTPPRRNTRIATPPSPMHGAKFDSWEPYSPRRSSRVAAKQTERPLRAQTPTRTSTLHIPKSTKPAPSNLATSSTSHQHQYRSLSPPTSPQVGMLPTPSKTPRKKAGRILFPPRPVTVEEAMPTSRKVRHENKSENAFSISALAREESIGGSQSSAIPIFTDSKERVPSLGGDDNPFLSRNAVSKQPSSANMRRKTKQKTDQELRMEESARNEEGMIYIFRGKKIFRRYDDRRAPVSDEEEEDQEAATQRRITGSSRGNRFTRSSYKPRLLFPNEEQIEERQKAEAEVEDEEALTDIELPAQQPTARRTARATTPVKESQPTAAPTTPPSTTRTTRSRAIKDAAAVKIPGNPFSQWIRKKPSSQELAGKGTKRGADELEAEDSKRRVISK